MPPCATSAHQLLDFGPDDSSLDCKDGPSAVQGLAATRIFGVAHLEKEVGRWMGVLNSRSAL